VGRIAELDTAKMSSMAETPSIVSTRGDSRLFWGRMLAHAG
jgi:hypothetical protein